MKPFIRTILFLNALITSTSAFAIFGVFDNLCPYMGIDYQQIRMHGNGPLNPIFPAYYPGFDFYIGAKFCPYWGFELGLDYTAKKTNTDILTGSFQGVNISQPHNVFSQVQRNGVHLDLVAFVPFWECWNILATVGGGYLFPQIYATDSTTGVTNNDNIVQSAIYSISSNKSKAFWRLRLGLSYMITECIGLRALIGWEGTKGLRVQGNTSYDFLNLPNNGFQNAYSAAFGMFGLFLNI